MKKALLAATALVSVGAILAVVADSSLQQRIDALKEEVSNLSTEAEGIVAKADEENRDLNADELERTREIARSIEDKNAQIEARERIVTSQAGAGRRTTPEPGRQPSNANDGRPRVEPVQPRINDRKGGFKSFGEFAVDVFRAAKNPGAIDRRLQAAATTYGSEGTGADGGFAVPPEFRAAIWQKVMDEENLLTRCEQLETGSNNMTVPKDETTPWQTTGGVQVYWEAEAAAATASKPALEMSNMRLQKLFGLVPVSDELLEDAPGLESWLRLKAPSKMAAKLNTAIIEGTGVGMPLGILRAASLVSVAKEGSQAADTILMANITKMWARMYAPCRRNAVWLINQDIEPQLDSMAFDPAASSKVPVYLGPSGLAGSPYATLKGRPVVPIEACKTLGDQGDIILVDLKQYLILKKAGQDIKTDVSMHLYFDQGLQAFRFIFRVNGQPQWNTAIAPQNGSATRSWAVTLDERA